MTTKDEALKVALDALKLGAAMYSPGGTAHAQIAAAIAACREALEQKDEAVVTTTTTIEALEQEIYENTRLFVPTAEMHWMLSKYHTAPPKRKG